MTGLQPRAALVMIFAYLWVGGCVERPPEVIRLPPAELMLGPTQEPMLTWPTARPAAIDAFALDPELIRPAGWHPLIDYCIDPSGHVTSVEVYWAEDDQTEQTIAALARGWTFAPWAGRPEARFCESAVVYADRRSRRRWSKSTIVVYLPIVAPVAPLPADGSLTVAPARLEYSEGSALRPFWFSARDQQDQPIEPGYGEIRLDVCVNRDRSWFVEDAHIELDWLPEDQRQWLAEVLLYNGWRFVPRLEHGVVTDDCEVEIRYAVWVLHHTPASFHEELTGHLNIHGNGFGLQLVSERATEAVPGPILGIDGAPPPVMQHTTPWVPPYELAATMPAKMGTRSVRVRFCVPAAGGHPPEVRVVDSDTQGPEEQALHRLVAEGVARWWAPPSDSSDASPRCAEVEWSLARYFRDVPDPRYRQ
jgi:hypothetical protein